jgi:hypothetical protein
MTRPTCPSSHPAPGAQILAVETKSGELAYVSTPIVLNEDTAERLTEQSGARPLIRFSGPCQESRCKQWTGTRCDVADRVVQQLVPLTRRGSLPVCGIRSTCRWYAQNGRGACEVCSDVRTVVQD